ncbi:MAG: OmpH family outer membrane protein [Saprospiraceae bacterium]
MKKIVYTFIFSMVSLMAFSQKFGYINSTEILSKVPEVALVDSSLRKYQDTLMIGFNVKLKVFQQHVQDYQLQSQNGSLAPVASQKKEEELTREQETLKGLDAELKQKLADRRDDLYSPILGRIDGVVRKIGKDNKYTMIFDSSQPGYLYLAESDDLGEVVLKEVLAGK